MSAAPPKHDQLPWEYPVASFVTGFSILAFKYPLDVVQTRFQVNNGRHLAHHFPKYNNTIHAISSIARYEGLKGLYAGFLPYAIGSTISTGLFLYYYDKAIQRDGRSKEENSSTRGLASYAKTRALVMVCLCTNPVSVVKTRLQLQTPLHQAQLYSGLYDAFRIIKREEGFSALYRGITPSLFLAVFRGAIQFTAYEELRKTVVDLKRKGSEIQHQNPDQILNSVDYGALGAMSKVPAILITNPFEVIRTRLQQLPRSDGKLRYKDTLHAVEKTARLEGIQGFYRGITPNILKSVPLSSLSFIVFENVLKLLKFAGGE